MIAVFLVPVWEFHQTATVTLSVFHLVIAAVILL